MFQAKPCLNFETKPDISGKTEPMENLGLWFSECQQKQNISTGHYEKIEKWLPFGKYALYGKTSN